MIDTKDIGPAITRLSNEVIKRLRDSQKVIDLRALSPDPIADLMGLGKINEAQSALIRSAAKLTALAVLCNSVDGGE